MEQTSGGTKFCRSFEYNFIFSSFVKEPKQGGIVPVILLFCKYKEVNWNSEHKVVGISPRMKFLSSRSVDKLFAELREFGKFWNRFLESFKDWSETSESRLISPSSLFAAKFKLVTVEVEINGPVNLLFEIKICDNLVISFNHCGIWSLKLLEASFKFVNEFKVWIISGIGPFNRLFDNCKFNNLDKELNDDGIVPIKLLDTKFKFVRDVNSPKYSGICPWSRFCFKFK